MEGLIAIIVIVLAVFVVRLAAKTQRRMEAAWSEVAERFGLALEGHPERISGEVDGLPVEARTFTRGSGDDERRYTEVKCRSRPPLAARLGSDGFFRRALDLADIEIGDPSFDRPVRVRGDRVGLYAVLDAELREVVQRAIEDDWSFEDGTWQVTRSGYLEDDLGDTITRGLELARAFSVHASQRPSRLRERTIGDHEPVVRARALATLVEAFPDHDATITALRAARADADPTVRLVSARALGDVTLLSELVAAPDVDVTLGALLELVERFPTHRETATSLDALAPRQAAEPARLRVGILWALSRVPRSWGEDAAIRRLDDRDDDVRVEAARTLAAIGSIARAVPALVPLRDKFLGGDLKDAARDAILAIRARAGSLDAGRLALVEDGAAGGLAIAQRGDDGPERRR